MTDGVVGEREGYETKAAKACRVGRGSECIPSLPAAHRSGIAAEGSFVLAVGDGDEQAGGRDHHGTNRQAREPGAAGAPCRDPADERRRTRTNHERH